MLKKVIFCAPNDFCAPATSSILVFSEYLSLLSLAYLVYHLRRLLMAVASPMNTSMLLCPLFLLTTIRHDFLKC